MDTRPGWRRSAVALDDGFDVFVLADACGGLTPATSWRFAGWSYDAARAIAVANGGGDGMCLAYAREMIHPA